MSEVTLWCVGRPVHTVLFSEGHAASVLRDQLLISPASRFSCVLGRSRPVSCPPPAVRARATWEQLNRFEDFRLKAKSRLSIAIFARQRSCRAPDHASRPRDASLSDTMCLLISFRKSTPPQNLQQDLLGSSSKQQVHDFVAELTF